MKLDNRIEKDSKPKAVKDARGDLKAAKREADKAKKKAKKKAKQAERADNRFNSGGINTKQRKHNKKAKRAKKGRNPLKVFDKCPKHRPSSDRMCDASKIVSKCYYGKSCQISEGVCQRRKECACVLPTGEATGKFECTKQDVCTECSNPLTGTKAPTMQPTLSATDETGPAIAPIGTATTSTSVASVNDAACPSEEPKMGVFVTCTDNLKCDYGEMECECAKIIDSGMWMCKIP
eukprot:scaffold82319_cov41-Attheya_sp.AAC.3